MQARMDVSVEEDGADEASVRKLELQQFIADEYASKILSATYGNPMNVQQISRACGIPIAVTYRRISKMEALGMLRCVGYEEMYRGKKVSYYQCAIGRVNMTFIDGKFQTEIQFLPETDMLHVGNDPVPSAERA